MRDTVEEPRGNGRQCPQIFEQQKPCFVQGCYSWIVSPWSKCTNQKGVCGHGVQTRNVTCVASGGLPVNATNCKPDLDIIILPVRNFFLMITKKISLSLILVIVHFESSFKNDKSRMKAYRGLTLVAIS